MKFVKAMMIGSMVTAGAMMMYSDKIDESKKMIMKKGKKLVKKISF